MNIETEKDGAIHVEPVGNPFEQLSPEEFWSFFAKMLPQEIN